LPVDYSHSDKPHYIYRGWTNRRSINSDNNHTVYDVPTQTDDSFLLSSNAEHCHAVHRSLLSMFTMNLALMIKLLSKLYPTVSVCLLAGELFQLEQQASHDIALYLHSMMGKRTPIMYRLKRESLISALGCALPRVYFDVIDDDDVIGMDCIS
jgi:hypothetical protein